MILLAAAVIAGAVAWSARQIAAALRAASEAHAAARMLSLVELFAPAIAAAREDPRLYLVWQPIARLTRQLLPEESAALDRAAGSTFPFGAADLQAAHAQWTTDWLAWERAHDAEYKLKAAVAAAELAASGNSEVARAKVDAVENEKLDRYQRRYAEYVRVARALQTIQP